MPKLARVIRFVVATAMVPWFAVQPSFAWGGDGHKMISRLAAANLPKEVPTFLRNGNALDMMEYMASEPDRWRNAAVPELSDAQSPEHFMDMEYLSLLDGTLPKKRFDFIRALAKAQAAHPEMKLQPEVVGLLPYVTEEVWQRLRNSLHEYRRLLAAGEDTKPVEAAALFYASWLAHYVADGSQPLHTTAKYNGWTGPNPNGYTTEHKIHSLFESVYVTANIKPSDVAPLVASAQPKVLNDEWTDFLSYLHDTSSHVEKVYQLEKAGSLTAAGTPDAKTFTEQRVAAGAIELRDMIYTAWIRSGDPVEEYHGSK